VAWRANLPRTVLSCLCRLAHQQWIMGYKYIISALSDTLLIQQRQHKDENRMMHEQSWQQHNAVCKVFLKPEDQPADANRNKHLQSGWDMSVWVFT